MAKTQAAYPTVKEVLSRENYEMNWVEYAEYIKERLPLAKQQAYIASGDVYRVDTSTVADEVETTPSVISSQRSKSDYSKENGFVGIPRIELLTTPVPGTVFRHIGSVEYFYSDEWDEDSNSGEVDVFAAVDHNPYVAVRKKYTESDEDVESPLEFGIVQNVTEFKVYESLESFLDESPHSPENIEPDGFHIETEGGLYK